MQDIRRASHETVDQIELVGAVAPPETLAAAKDISTPQPDVDTVAETSRSRSRLWAIVFALYTVLFVAALDQTVITTAIPTITNDLGSAAGYTWIGSAFLLASASSGPLWTKGSDIWGRKPALLSAVGIFAIASLIAALARNMAMLIAVRALQGAACGGIGQLVYVTTSDLFSIRDRALMFGLQGGVYAIAGSAGPLIGGAFSQYATWRWCFWINLPVCAVSFGLLILLLDTHNPRTPLLDGLKAVDWAGAVTMLGMSLSFLLGLEFGGAVFPWNSATVICLIVIGVSMVGAFLYAEKKIARYPLMPLAVFGSLSNAAIIVVAVGHSIVSIGVEYFLPLYLQSVQRLSPFQSGLLLLPWCLTAAITDISSGGLIHRTGRCRELVWAGAATMTLGVGLLIHLWTGTPLSQIIGFQIISGIGVALLFQTPVLVLQTTAKQCDVASATATLGFLRSLATALSVVIGGAVFQNGMGDRHGILASAGLNQDVLDALQGSSAAANIGIVDTVSDPAQRSAVLDAYAWSVRNIFILYTCVSGCALLASLFVAQSFMSTEHTETKTGIQHLSKREVDAKT